MWWTRTVSRTVTIQFNRCNKAQPRKKISIKYWPRIRLRDCPVEILPFTPIMWPSSIDWVPSIVKWGKKISPIPCMDQRNQQSTLQTVSVHHELSITMWKLWWEDPTPEGSTYFGHRKDHRNDTGTDLRASSMVTSFYGTRKCCSDWLGRKDINVMTRLKR